MDRPGFVYVTYIATTPEKLWAALTEGELSREHWGGRAVESDWEVGSPVRFRMANGDHDPVRGTESEADRLEGGSEVDAGLRRGWPAILSSLKSFLETGRGLEVTKRWGEAGL